MSDDELLARATSALRDEVGEREATRAALGRVRVLGALRARGVRRRRLGSAGVAACVTLLCAGAWAAATGRVPLARLLHGDAPPTASTSAPSPPRAPAASPPRALAPAASAAPPVRVGPAVPAVAAAATVAAPPAAAPRAAARSARTSVVSPRETHAFASAPPAPSPSVDPSAPATPAALVDVRAAEVPPGAAPEDPAEALYRAAHLAHFATRDARSALDAWDRYLAAAPEGRFAPEARYNRALSLVRLGRAPEAREALAPFAEAPAGSYRQREAAALRARLASAPCAESPCPLGAR